MGLHDEFKGLPHAVLDEFLLGLPKLLELIDQDFDQQQIAIAWELIRNKP